MSMAQSFLTTANRNIKRRIGKLVGKMAIIKPIMDRLRIQETVNNLTNGYGSNHIKVDNGTMGEILIYNRLTSPRPLYQIEEWVDEKTCVGDLYNLEKGAVNDDRIANTLDEIHPNLHTAWNQIITHAIKEFDIPINVFYHDITSLYFEGDYDESSMIEHGYSRDNKQDKKQVNLDTTINRTQIPVMYRLLNGSTSDKKTAVQNMEDLLILVKGLPQPTNRIINVGDRMLLDDEIIVEYHLHDIDYLGPLKLTNVMKEAILDIPEENFLHIPLRNGDGLYEGTFIPWTFTSKNEKNRGISVTDRVLVVKSLQKARLDKKTRDEKIEQYQKS
jgi:transposase